nr:putative reverse transcriptase, RNA-dependent DNA polymerase [Tanacetum cinerariifolium]
DTIRVLLLVASNQGWPLHQFDVKNAFLNGELKEEVYMEAPPGFSEHFKHREACRLKKSLYGLKQSLRAWFGRFMLAMKRYGFKQSNSVHTMFLKIRKNHVTCLIIYVDDMVITRNYEEEIKRLKERLFTEFEMKDLGNLKYFIGIEVLRSPKGIFICQKKYILDLFAEIGMINCKPADTSMMVSQKLFMKKKAKLADQNRRSTSGYFSSEGGKLVIWKSKKQKVVSLSSVEAEFRGTDIFHKHYNINGFPQRHSGGFPGDLSLGIPYPGGLSPGKRRWGRLVRDSFPGDNPRGKGGSHVFFSQELSATVTNFPR